MPDTLDQKIWPEIEKSLERNIASRLIKIQGIKWVESFLSLPSSEQNTFYHSLINSIQEPLIAIKIFSISSLEVLLGLIFNK